MAKDKQAALPSSEKTAEPKQLTLADRVESELMELTDDNFYSVTREGGNARRIPDSKALQYYANRKGGFASKILESGMSEERAWAHVQMWPVGKPEMVKEDKVTIVYDLEFQNFVWDRVARGCQFHRSGCPIALNNGVAIIDERTHTPLLTDIRCQLEIRRQLNRKMKFAERECITKAEGRLHMKFLNFDWREQDEIENEVAEVRLVGSDKKSAAAAPGPFLQAPTPQTASVPQAKPQEEAKPASKKKEEPTGPPKAIIPSEEEMARRAAEEDKAKAAAPQTAAPANGSAQPKKNSERMAIICEKVGCSQTHILSFIAKSLAIEDVNQLSAKAKKTEITAVVTAVEETVARYPATLMGQFLRGEMKDGPQHQEIGKYYLDVFAREMKKAQ